MHVIAIMALGLSVCNLFLLAYLLGRGTHPGAARHPSREGNGTAEEQEDEETKRAREKIQAGMDSIMSYEVPRGFAGDEARA